MGIGRPIDPKWAGPGIAYGGSYGEMTQRVWYAEWLRRMRQPSAVPSVVQRPGARVATS